MKITNVTIDATNKSLGRVATVASSALRGKNRADFDPSRIPPVRVIITNAFKMRYTGKKLDQKKYYHFSGYPGGLRETGLREMLAKSPEKVVRLAVQRMLPDNKLKKRLIIRLYVKP